MTSPILQNYWNLYRTIDITVGYNKAAIISVYSFSKGNYFTLSWKIFRQWDDSVSISQT